MELDCSVARRDKVGKKKNPYEILHRELENVLRLISSFL